jgi:hypothetical protein
MKTLLLVVDDKTCHEFENLCPITKQALTHEVGRLISKYSAEARSVKLRQLIDEINNSSDTANMNSEILLDLLPID